MKRFIVLTLLFSLLFGCASADVNEQEIELLIRIPSMWGISRKAFNEQLDGECSPTEYANGRVLRQSGIQLNGEAMDAYYIFGLSTWDSEGYTYWGLSKVVYLLNEGEPDLNRLQEVYMQFVGSMRQSLGEPSLSSKAVTTWDRDNYKLEIGIGNFQKYGDPNPNNVTVVITGTDIIRPVTPPPTPKPQPKHTYRPPLPLNDETKQAGIKYITDYVRNFPTAKNNGYEYNVRAVYCQQLSNPTFRFYGCITEDYMLGIGLKLMFKRKADGSIQVIEVGNNIVIKAWGERIPGESIWGEKDFNKNAKKELDAVADAFEKELFGM